MKKGMLYFTIILMASGCKEGWSNEAKEQYMQACEDSPNASGLSALQRKNYCSCSMEVVMKHYSSIDEVLINEDSTVVNAAMLECRAKATQ